MEVDYSYKARDRKDLYESYVTVDGGKQVKHLREAIWKKSMATFQDFEGIKGDEHLRLWKKSDGKSLELPTKLSAAFKDDEDKNVSVTPVGAEKWNDAFVVSDRQKAGKWDTPMAQTDVKEELIRVFGDRIRHARTLLPTSNNRLLDSELPLKPDQSLLDDIGQYFPLQCRKSSFRAALYSTIKVFQLFMREPASLHCSDELTEAMWKRNGLLMMLIAYPGSGKTTFGKALRDLLVVDMDNYNKGQPSCLAECLKHFKPQLECDFKQMIKNSLKHNFALHHTLHADAGAVMHLEKGLSARNILGLRVFYSTFGLDARHGYMDFLDEIYLLGKGVLTAVDLQMVFEIIRGVLRVPAHERILLLLFFDEVNAARRRLGWIPGREQLEDGLSDDDQTTWAQQLFSEYISHLSDTRQGMTLPILFGATTRHSAASLKFTESGSTRSYLIPLPPLSQQATKEMVIALHRRLELTMAKSTQVWDVPQHVKDLLQICGGMPRLLAYAFRALLLKSDDSRIGPEELLNALEKTSVNAPDMRRVTTKLERMVFDKVVFRSYVNVKKFPVLERAFGISILGRMVRRKDQVLHPFCDRWGDLEAQGVVLLNLTNHSEHHRRKRLRMNEEKQEVTERKVVLTVVGGNEFMEEDTDVPDTTDVGSVEVHVSFCPLMLKYIVEYQEEEYISLWPEMWQTADWRTKEEADILTLLFKLRLMKQFGQNKFRLTDLLPRGIRIPVGLTELCLNIPDVFVRPKPIPDAGSNDCWAFMGRTNYGADSMIFLTQKSESRGNDANISLIIESKKRVEAATVSLNSIMRKQKHVTAKHKHLLDARGSLKNIFLYITDEKLINKDNSRSGESPGSDLMENLIVWDASVLDEGPLHALAALRHYKYLFQEESSTS